MNQLILVVEDDATMQKLTLKILSSRGFSSELARSGREAVTMAAALKPALILMDLSLPEMNGWEATRALKADPALAQIPVVAITAHAIAARIGRASHWHRGVLQHRLHRHRRHAGMCSADQGRHTGSVG